MKKLDRAFALTGVVFVVLTVVSFVIAGSTPDAHDSASKVVSFYAKHHSKLYTAGFVIAIPAAFLALFTGALRQRFRRTDGGSIAATTAAVAGGTIAAGGMMLFGGTQIALGDASGHVSATTMQTLNVIGNDSFVPWMAGFGVLLLGTGIATLQTRALPRAIGYISTVLGVLVFTPVGWWAFLLGALVMAVASVIMAVRPAPAAGGDDRKVVTPAGEQRIVVPS
jgi:uncharacterized BrkB/YihY/UPF0761 family membrane protein